MKLTSRGRVVLVAVIVAVIWGVVFGLPALTAVVVPGVIALAGAAILVRRANLPTIERRPVPPGFPGEERQAELVVTVNGSLPVVIADTVPAGIRPADDPSTRTVTTSRLSFRFVSDRRGVAAFGPVRVHVIDPLGLVKARSLVDTRTEVVTYPPRRAVDNAGDALASAAIQQTGARHTFDQLREYETGDALRDVHWPSSAKQPDDELIVKEYQTEAEQRSVLIVAESAPKHADAMASAAASVALELLETGVDVGLETADAAVPVGRGHRHRHRLLKALANTNGGHIRQADPHGTTITVSADRHGISIERGERVTRLDGTTTPRGHPVAGGSRR